MTNFEKWAKQFRSHNLQAFNADANAQLWLKTRAVCRGKQLKQFLAQNDIKLLSTKISEQNIELFHILENMPSAMNMLDAFLRVKSHNWYDAMNIDETQLREDLYKVQYYAWGGDQNNSLDKHLVSRYVKVISRYDELAGKKDEIADNAWNYVQTSWYNNWTSYLIESLFKRHPKVVSAVGEIKNVDFFIGNMPVDLKVTFFPNQYMDMKLKEKLGKKEISWMKSQAKKHGISYDSTFTDTQLMYALTEKFAEQGFSWIVTELRQKRREVILETKQKPLELMRWLYSNQGEMRFGAENRLFVILVNAGDMSQSWKMKRAISLIEPQVKQYLDNFNENSLTLVDFTFKQESYHSLADTIFLIKNNDEKTL